MEFEDKELSWVWGDQKRLEDLDRAQMMDRGRQWVGWANQSAAQIPNKVAGHVDFPCLGVSGSETCPGGSFVGHMVFAGV